ncbi:MAG: DUF1573 domain-containing protein [Bacteroidales bacterium]|nr:DUF1573 domain-containing protein [Bacteroidales bacterium]MCF8456456.1 DUF1573 domain-containing protein [Bacteroidales bacterium]
MNKAFKVVLLLILSLSVLVSCKTDNSQQGQEQVTTDIIQNPVTAYGDIKTEGLPAIRFENTEHDFGAIIEGEIVEHTFNFTNTGGSDLVLTKVSASCGCTIPKYDTSPVAPGEHGKIVVSFNSENRKGSQSKTIKVLANTQPNLTELKITANILY